MSWNAKRFHRVVEELKRTDQVSRDALCIWLTADAVDRLHASGGYIEDSATAFDVLDDLLNGKLPSDTVVVGLGADPKWTDFIEVVEGYVPASRERIVFGGLSATCRDIAATQLEQWGEVIPDAELAALVNLTRSDVGGLIFTDNGTQSSIWSGARDDDRIRQTALETVATALLMYADVNARADAACVSSIQTITVPRRRGTPTHDVDVQVIDVRRRADGGSPNGGDRATRDFRWVTRGHYRTYWTGEGRTIKRRRWISEYINGPEDAPMRNPKRVYRI